MAIKELISSLKSSCTNDRSIRAMIIVGSYALFDKLHDEGSDVDLVIVVRQSPTVRFVEEFLRKQSTLISRFGPQEFTKAFVDSGRFFKYESVSGFVTFEGVRVDIIFRTLENIKGMLAFEHGSEAWEYEAHTIAYSKIVYEDRGIISDVKKKVKLTKSQQPGYVMKFFEVHALDGLTSSMRNLHRNVSRGDTVQCLHYFNQSIQYVVKLVVIMNGHPLSSTSHWRKRLNGCKVKPRGFEERVERIILSGDFKAKYDDLMKLISEFVALCGHSYGGGVQQQLQDLVSWMDSKKVT